ncbi:probable RNA methyltransferase CG1239 [Episyrphus balteatus]|uniref:probable RNA methyltransferase CG1239 n=1 Tax=Episyrphus balteatus TaxID=286459 RepID=UPI002485F466|nr:probable RNA methyltransferase CG1239 [Episyrphus balteatus]
MNDLSPINNNNLLEEATSKIGPYTKPTNLKRNLESNPLSSPAKQPKYEKCDSLPSAKPHSSPKKRIDITVTAEEPKNKFIYGNYSRYYGYRNSKDFHDVRLDVFEANKELFNGKEILDIGCNSGLVTMEVAKKLEIKHITGIDIDKGLINKTIKFISKLKKSSSGNVRKNFPFNVSFIHGNYVLRDDILLEIEEPQFDLILCLSVTKWIHLNFGDNALKQAFRRMYAQLRHGGRLILEPQPWDGYKRRKKLTPEIFKNYREINFKPQDFTDYLLSSEVGFKSVTLLAVPDHRTEGFRRPIQLFLK